MVKVENIWLIWTWVCVWNQDNFVIPLYLCLSIQFFLKKCATEIKTSETKVRCIYVYICYYILRHYKAQMNHKTKFYMQKIIFIITFCIYTELIFLNYIYLFLQKSWYIHPYYMSSFGIIHCSWLYFFQWMLICFCFLYLIPNSFGSIFFENMEIYTWTKCGIIYGHSLCKTTVPRSWSWSLSPGNIRKMQLE